MKPSAHATLYACLLLVSICLLGVSPAHAQRETKPVDSPEFDLEHAKRVLTQEIEETLQDTGIPSISIALLRGDRIVWAKAFGYSNVKLKVPATSRTIYSTGSCMKPVTAMAIMQLVDDGKIGLDDPINAHLGDAEVDDFSKGKKPVSFRHLLSHYSGLTIKHEIVPLWERRLPKSLQQLASELSAEQEPGTEYRYSNSGYALSGLLIEKVSGMTYEEYLVEKIFKPVGVTLDGPIQPTPTMIEEMALPYRLQDRKPVPEVRYRFDVYPAGDAYLSVPAMAKILLTQINHGKHNGVSLLSAASVKEMQTPQFGGRDGMDFGIKMFDGEKLIMHGGGVPGFSTKFILGVDSKVGVYIAANATGAQLPNQILAQRAMDLLLAKKPGRGLLREITGLGFQPEVDKQSGLIRIANVFPKSPASRAGLTVGQKIRTANGASVARKSLPEFLKMISGAAGESVKLEVVGTNREQSQTITISRGKFLVPS